jgi:hypothetical protein
MKKKRNPRKRIGTSLALAWALLLVALLPLAAAPKKKPALDTYAVVSGSVFDSSGYALPGADVTLAPETQTQKLKPMEAASDARGEFVVRVPPGPMHYTVTVHAKGYRSEQKTVSVEDQERVEVTFQLERESK